MTTYVINLSELTGEELVDANVAAQLLGIAVRTVRDMASRRELPIYKIGRSVRFKVSELKEWRESKKIS